MNNLNIDGSNYYPISPQSQKSSSLSNRSLRSVKQKKRKKKKKKKVRDDDSSDVDDGRADIEVVNDVDSDLSELSSSTVIRVESDPITGVFHYVWIMFELCLHFVCLFL